MNNINKAENLNKELNEAAFWLNKNLGFKLEHHTALCYLYYQRNFYLNYGCESNEEERLKAVREWKCTYGNN